MYKEKTLSAQQRQELSTFEIQIEDNSADDNVYTRLGIPLGTAANIATIASSVAALFGLA